MASPASFATVVAGRVGAVMLAGLIAVPEVVLVAGVGFGHWIGVAHPVLLIVTVVLTVVSTSGMALMMSALFVLARSARLFQNSVTMPLFVLGGVLVPVRLLPVGLQVIARVVYLSWATDLLRDATTSSPVHDAWARLAVLAALGALSIGLGTQLVARVVRIGRTTGSLGFA